MQFVAKGPDIPNALLQAHEEGRVVFFCGAGVSYPAGLPGFEGLVQKLYERVGDRRDHFEEESFAAKQFDRTLGHFESRVQGGKRSVRRHLVEILSPDLDRRRALTSHMALLALARQRSGALRLVTTNFDTLFEVAAEEGCLPHFAVHPEPPARRHWEGLVYLHGRLQSLPSEDDLDRLVLSDADFGKAYLLEAWAARFVSALFRDHVVCFVGYSIDDPVLRYMTAAHATNTSAVALFAFASFGLPADRESQDAAWRAKNVTPILYCDENAHKNLHRSLQMWASLHRDGVAGYERIVSRLARRSPRASTNENDFVGRMLWALSHESGLPAKRFADFNPVPPIEWLEALAEDRYQHGDLNRFGVAPQTVVDNKLRFSLVRRPATYGLAPSMTLVAGGVVGSGWDEVMRHLSRWLIRHLNDPTLVLWLADHGGQLHPRWSWLIEHELDRLASLRREGKTAELDDIRAQARNAIPGPPMQILWRLLLTGRLKSLWHRLDLYRWKDRVKRDGLMPTLRLELRELLAPKVTLKKPFHWGAVLEESGEPSRINQLVDWDLVLTADHVHSALGDLADEGWRKSLPTLLDDFQQLLRDALDLRRELGQTDVRSDRSHWDLPSITPHRQNRGHHDWVVLIELLRDAWLATLKSDPKQARRIALAWFELPYATFKRLALYAASQDTDINTEQWCEWLLADGAWWLWSVETQRETMRLLVLQGAQLTPSARATLENAILVGPPRHMYRDDLDPGRWQHLIDESVWLHLAKLREAGGQLGEAATQRVGALTAENPGWQLASNEQDEFSGWMTGTGDPDFEASRHIDIAPRKRRELVDWLQRPAARQRPFDEDTWQDVCRTRFFHSHLALCDLAAMGIWPQERWREALQVWSEAGKVVRSWRFAAPLMQRMPDAVIVDNIHAITWWMEAVSKSIDRHETIMFDLCRRVFGLPLNADTGIWQNGEPIDRPVAEAINHPIGHATQVLLNLWLGRKPGDNDSLPGEIEPFFTQLCDVSVGRFRHGRVLLASRLITLFRVDRSWTQAHLLPLFDWSRSLVEGKAAWEGFLWSPRLYGPLLMAFKTQFLSTSQHYNALGEHSRQYAALLTHAALEPIDGYTPKDFQVALGSLPPDGLIEVAQALSQALESEGEQREEYWKNRVQPFWHRVWPKSRDLASHRLGEALARLCIAARAVFPAALSTVVDWLRPIEHSDFVVHLLHESGLCVRYPDSALRLLEAIIDDQPWAPTELGQCLDAIVQARPLLCSDNRYQLLMEYLRRRGH